MYICENDKGKPENLLLLDSGLRFLLSHVILIVAAPSTPYSSFLYFSNLTAATAN